MLKNTFLVLAISSSPRRAPQESLLSPVLLYALDLHLLFASINWDSPLWWGIHQRYYLLFVW